MSPQLTKYAPLMGLAIAALVVISAVLTRKDNPDLLRFTVEENRAYGVGFTDGRSIGVVRQLVRENPQVDTLVLANMPGTRDVVSNDRLGREIRKAGLKTHLEKESFIASGAVSLFLAGVERTMDCGAKIGVHAWGSTGFDAQDTGFDNMRAFKRDYLSDMGVNPDFYDYTKRAARADDLHIMSPDEVRDWQLFTTPLGECS